MNATRRMFAMFVHASGGRIEITPATMNVADDLILHIGASADGLSAVYTTRRRSPASRAVVDVVPCAVTMKEPAR